MSAAFPGDEHTQTLLANYFLISNIGKGGFSQIYLASNAFFQPVSVKCLKASRNNDPEAVQSFLREIQILSHLKHPYIVPVLDHGKIGSTYFYVSPLVVSITVFDLMCQFKEVQKPIPLPLALYLIEECISILEFIHSQKVFKYSNSTLFHGDFTPDNILFSQDATLRIIDFGNATQETEAEASRKLFGKIYYTPSEVLSGQSPKKTIDVYSLSMMLFELLFGEKPFLGANREELIKQIKLGVNQIPPSDHLVHKPTVLEEFFKKALHSSEAQRFTSVQTWRAEFAKIPFKQKKCINNEQVFNLLPPSILTTILSTQKNLKAHFDTFLKSPQAKKLSQLTESFESKSASRYELRKTPRIFLPEALLMAHLQDPTSHKKFPVAITQLSSGGMLVRWNEDMKQKGKAYLIRLPLGKGYHELSLEGSTIYSITIEKRVFMAFAFKKMNELTKKTIEHFVVSRCKEQSEQSSFQHQVIDYPIDDLSSFAKEQKNNLLSKGLSMEYDENLEEGQKVTIRLHFLKEFSTISFQCVVLFKSLSEKGKSTYGFELNASPYELTRLKAVLQKA